MTFRKLISHSIKSSFILWLKVMKIMIPISVITKLLVMFGLIKYLGIGLSPIMMLVGLPGLLGIVWAVTLMTNLWSGALMFLSISSLLHLTTGDITILGTLMLLAHGLPLELKMVSKCGISGIFSGVLRISSALLLAHLMHITFQYFHILNEPAKILLNETVENNWFLEQIKSYAIVFIMISSLVLFLDILKHYRLIQHLGKILAPYLGIMGLSREAASVTLVGTLLGLIYGGALLLREVESGEVSFNDKVISITSLNLFHSLIEDTIIIVLMGGAVLWLIIPRFILTIIVMRIILLMMSLNRKFTLKLITNSNI